jgi:hypothetical protein
MGHRDELLRRMKESGELDALPPDERQKLYELDDEEARWHLVTQDALDSNFVNLSDEELQRFGLKAAEEGFRNLFQVFGGRLVDDQRGQLPRLTRLGRALADFLAKARAGGFSALVVLTELSSLETIEGFKPSELASALADFVATARACGFSETDTVKQLSSATWLCLMVVERLAASHEP